MNNIKHTAFISQIGGDHYKTLAIQPAEYCQRNRLGFCESSVVKYVTRHRTKNGRQDIEKAIHFLEMLIEMEYPVAGPEFNVVDASPQEALGIHRKSKLEQVMESGLGRVIDAITEPTGSRELARRIVAHATNSGLLISKTTAFNVVAQLEHNRAIKRDANDMFTKA